jgi:hypothetical protein
MINNASLTVKQAEIVKAMRAFFKGKNTVTRNQMVEFMQKTYNQKYAPEFIVKNEGFKAKDKEGVLIRGEYRLPAAVASPESRAKEKAKAAVKATKASTKRAPKTTEGTETVTVKRVSKGTPKLSQAAKDRRAALEAAADAVETVEQVPELTRTVGSDPTE